MMLRAAAASVATVLLLGACGSGSGSGGHSHDEEASAPSTASTVPPFTKAEATTAVEVVLQDYAFVGLPDTVRGPNLFVTASIKGSNTHELVVFDEHDEVVEDLRPFKSPARQSLAVVLEPGTYVVRCLVKEGSRTHADLGMRRTFVVAAS
jgi:hypothetical protein